MQITQDLGKKAVWELPGPVLLPIANHLPIPWEARASGWGFCQSPKQAGSRRSNGGA